MSIEAAFRKVSEEIGSQSVALAEELTLTTAELSYLPDRRAAYENLAKRTDLDGVKSVCMPTLFSRPGHCSCGKAPSNHDPSSITANFLSANSCPQK